MKKILGSLKLREFKLNGVEFLNDSDMLKIRGGVETDKPKTRPREIIEWEEL